MEFKLITKEHFELLLSELRAIKTELGKIDRPKEEEWLTPKQVCDMLQICSKTLYNYIDRGWFHPRKMGKVVRFKKSEVVAAIDKGLVKTRRR